MSLNASMYTTSERYPPLRVMVAREDPNSSIALITKNGAVTRAMDL